MNPTFLLLAQVALPATPETRWEFWAVMGYLTLQTLYQIYTKQQTNRIEKQTNGLVVSQVEAAAAAGHAQGEIEGVKKEQAAWPSSSLFPTKLPLIWKRSRSTSNACMY